MPMTYIGSIYQKYNKDLNEWVTHYLRTHANAVITTEDRTFVSEEQKEFLSSLMGDGSGTEGTAYGELVNKVNILEQFKVGIEDLFTEGIGSTTIDQLHEIVNFVSGSNIGEGMTLGQFINSLNKLKINNQSIAGIDYSIYAPTSAGTAGYVLKSNGSGAPTWTNNLTLTSLVVNTDITVGGKLLGSLKDIGTSESPFGTAYVNSIRSNQIYANGKNVTSMKNAVTKATQPTAEDYGRNELVDGLVWVDTGTAPITPASWRHSLTLKYIALKTSEVNDLMIYMGTSAEWGDFFKYVAPNMDLDSIPEFKIIPIVEFETSSGIVILGFNKRNDMDDIHIGISLFQSDNDGDGLYTVINQSSNITYNSFSGTFFIWTWRPGDEISVNVGENQEIVIPSARIIANNLHLLPVVKNFKFVVNWELA